VIKAFVKDFVKYLPTAIVPAVVGLISVPVLTRLFSPGDYGNYTLVLTTVNIFAIVNAWLSMSVIRFLPSYEREGKLKEFTASVIQTTVISICGIALLFALALILIPGNGETELRSMMQIGIAIFALNGLIEVLLHFLRARRQVWLFSIFRVWQVTTTLAFGLLFIVQYECGVRGMLYGALLSGILMVPLLWSKSVGPGRFRPCRVSRTMLREMAAYSFPLVAANLSAWVLNFSNRFFLKWFCGSDDVGIYSASYNISQRTVMLFVTVFVSAFGPLIIHVWEKQDKKATEEYLTKLTRLFFMLCVPAIVGLSVLAKPLVGVMTQEEYLLGYRIVPFVTCGALLIGLQQIYQTPFLLHHKTVPITVCFALAAIFNVVLNIYLMPKYGYMAAAFNSMVCYALYFALVAVCSRKYMQWAFPLKPLTKILLAATIMGSVSYYLGNHFTASTVCNLTLAVSGGILVYFSVLFLLGEFSKADIRAILALKQKS